MNKILVQVYLPAVQRSYDVFIPRDSRLHEVIELMSAALKDLTQGYFSASKDAVLCDSNTGVVLNINSTVSELGLRNGSRLIMI